MGDKVEKPERVGRLEKVKPISGVSDTLWFGISSDFYVFFEDVMSLEGHERTVGEQGFAL